METIRGLKFFVVMSFLLTQFSVYGKLISFGARFFFLSCVWLVRQTDVFFNSLTYVYLALLPQHRALYAKVDSTPTYIYTHICRKSVFQCFLITVLDKKKENVICIEVGKKETTLSSRQACFVINPLFRGF